MIFPFRTGEASQRPSAFCFLTPFIFVVVSLGVVLPTSGAGAPPLGVPSTAKRLENFNEPHLDAWQFENSLYLEVKDRPDGTAPDSEGLRIPRLANVVEQIELLGHATEKFQLQPEPTFWRIRPAISKDKVPALLMIRLDAPATVFNPDFVSKPDEENAFYLPARLAITSGSTLRYEPQPHKNTVGYWSNEKDFAEWKLSVRNAGAYEVDILQGCGKGHGGSSVELRIQQQSLMFQVQETGHFQNFVWRTVGTVQLKSGDSEPLQLVPTHKVSGAVMDVRAIRLVPVGMSRSFKAELADPDSFPKP